jgi:tetratricopeptide (TPR) repeat protein
MSYKDEQNELKQPDELQKIGETAVPWLEQHGKNVTVGVVVVLIIGAALSLASHMSAKGEENATVEYGNALRLLDRQVSATSTATGDEAPFKTEQEKDDALVAKLTEFRAKNAGRKAASNAALPLAQALLRQGKAAEAQPLIEEFLKGADANDPMRAAALEARGYAFEAQSKYDEALSAFEQLSRENKTDYLKGMGLYHRGRLLLLKGDKEGGAKQLVEIEAQAPNTAAARLAKERIALLVAQGVPVPQAPAPAPTPAAAAAPPMEMGK